MQPRHIWDSTVDKTDHNEISFCVSRKGIIWNHYDQKSVNNNILPI